MKKDFLSLIIVLFFLSPLSAQKEASIWYFGENAGMDFNQGDPIPLTDGALNTIEGCASICASDGNLLFYTDGVSVWNKNHWMMPNGFELMGDPSSSQSGVIIPNPGSPNIYYIFTVDEGGGANGFRYSEVDMNLQGGLGDVTLKNNPLFSPSCEKITAVRHQNNGDIWVIGHFYGNNSFYAYLVSSAGVETTPVISNTGIIIEAFSDNALGYLKAAPSGKKVAIANRGQGIVEILDFDNSTGILSNPITLPEFSPNAHGPYGLEFSTDGRYLYVTEEVYINKARLFQYDLEAGSLNDIIDSEFMVAQSNQYFGALQMAPDEKIYLAKFQENSLGVIHNPDGAGNNCDFELDGFDLGGQISTNGLPTFITSFFSIIDFSLQGDCFGNPTFFELINSNNQDSILWDFGDPQSGDSNTSIELEPSHVFSDTGSFTITLLAFSDEGIDTVTHDIFIKGPFIDLGKDTTLCMEETLLLNANWPGADYLWQDNSTQSTFEVESEGLFWVTLSADGCEYTDSISVSFIDCSCEIKLPNAFTPNNDGVNDIFRLIPPIDACSFTDFNFKIFNRWGTLIFESDSELSGWDGRYENKPVPSDAYIYIISYRLNDDTHGELKGDVTLIR